jgi:hypothetical protein
MDALLCQKRIITKKYLNDLIEICEASKFGNVDLPDPKKYIIQLIFVDLKILK